MSGKTAVASLVLAVGLGGLAYVLLQRQDAPAQAGPLLDFKPSQVVALAVDRGPAGREATHRLGDGAEWEIRWAPGGEPEVMKAWPANPGNVRAALRILSTLTSAAPADEGLHPDETTSALVTVTLDDGTERAIRLAREVIAGRALAEVLAGAGGPGGHVTWVESGISEALVATGLRAWREKSAFPGLGRDVSRVTLTSGDGSLALAKVQGRWGLRAPLAAPADEQAVNALLDRLAAMPISDFGDAGIPVPTEALPPIASLLLETDRREPSGDSFLTRTLIRHVEFAAIAGLAGDQVLVRLTRHEESRAQSGSANEENQPAYVFTVPLADVAALSPAPEAYISRTAATAAAADVGRLAIRGSRANRTFVRSIDGWTESQAADAAPVPPADAAAVEALLRLTCEARATTIRLEPVTDRTVTWTLDLQTRAGDPLATIEVARAAGDGPGLLLLSGPVWRTYATDATPLLSWLQASVP